ncbi:hypothetical protein Lser_V15G16103 [Lactuca serriola]
MANTRSRNRNQNHDDASCRKKRFKTRDKSGVIPWSDLNHDVLLLVLMKLGAVDFIAFSGVCKSWRSLALPNKKMFMQSRPPMSIWIKDCSYKKECYLQDFEGIKFKIRIPNSIGRRCVGLTCGFLILFGSKVPDFWLVNPITRHQLYFPPFPCLAKCDSIKSILVFSPSISGWVLVAFLKYSHSIWFCILGKGEWIHVYSAYTLLDLLAFKGKIYTLSSISSYLCEELKLYPNPKLTLLKTNNFPKPAWSFLHREFVNAGEKLYLLDRDPKKDLFRVQELDFGEMKWVLLEGKEIEEYGFFLSVLNISVAIKPKSLTNSQLLHYRRYAITKKSRKGRFNIEHMWYFPHECLNVNIIHE